VRWTGGRLCFLRRPACDALRSPRRRVLRLNRLHCPPYFFLRACCRLRLFLFHHLKILALARLRDRQGLTAARATRGPTRVRFAHLEAHAAPRTKEADHGWKSCLRRWRQDFRRVRFTCAILPGQPRLAITCPPRNDQGINAHACETTESLFRRQ